MLILCALYIFYCAVDFEAAQAQTVPEAPAIPSWNDIGNPPTYPEENQEFLDTATKILAIAQQYNIPYSIEIDYQNEKVVFYTPQPETLRKLLETQESIQAVVESIDYVHPTGDTSPINDEPNPIIESYANDMGLDYAEAERRLNLQSEMSSLVGEIIKHEPSFSGSSIQHEPEFGLVVFLNATDGDALIQKYLEGVEWAGLVSVQQTEYTDDEFLEISEQVLSAISTIDIPFESGISPGRSKITLYTPLPDELQLIIESIAGLDSYLEYIEYVYQEKTSEPAAPKYPYLVGNVPLSSCTSGFVVIRNDNGLSIIH